MMAVYIDGSDSGSRREGGGMSSKIYSISNNRTRLIIYKKKLQQQEWSLSVYEHFVLHVLCCCI